MKSSTFLLCLVALVIGTADAFAVLPRRHRHQIRVLATTGACLMVTTPTSHASDRRSVLASAGVVFLAAIAATTVPVAMAATETEDFSNDFIQTLKARSDGKRDDYTKQAQDGKNTTWKKLNTAKFSSQYNRPSFSGVQRADKTFQMVTPNQLEVLKKEGKVIFEYETKLDRKGNEYIDYPQGEIFKFANE